MYGVMLKVFAETHVGVYGKVIILSDCSPNWNV